MRLRRVSLIATLSISAVVASGCGGCAFPFSTESQGQVRIKLGDMTPDCGGTGNETLDNGDCVDWEHLNEDPNCHVTSTWTGVFLNMQETRDEMNKQIEDAGLDPETVSVHITSIEITIDKVTIQAEENGATVDKTDAVAGVIHSYHGVVALGTKEAGTCPAVDIVRSGDLITVDATAADGNILDPSSNINDSDALTKAANDAISNDENVEAVGDAELFLDLANIDPTFTGLIDPELVLDMTVKTNGDAIAN